MQPRPSFDRLLLIPLVISIVSILGIGWIFLARDRSGSPISPSAMPSSVSTFEVVTLTPSPSVASTKDEHPPVATWTNSDAFSGLPAETLPSTSAVITETLPPPSATLTPDRIQPLRAGKYDDTDSNIAYDPYWTVLKNSSTVNSYKGTIHASFDAGSEASFRFTGKRFRLGYKRGKSFGTVTVIIDGQVYSFNEQAFDLVWSSPQLSTGDHFVQIVHESGESINLDYIEIVD
jgi:hypothetical protein